MNFRTLLKKLNIMKIGTGLFVLFLVIGILNHFGFLGQQGVIIASLVVFFGGIMGGILYLVNKK